MLVTESIRIVCDDNSMKYEETNSKDNRMNIKSKTVTSKLVLTGLIAISILANISPAWAGRDGVPGRRVGGGSRAIPELNASQCPPNKCLPGDTLEMNTNLEDLLETNVRSRRRNRIPK